MNDIAVWMWEEDVFLSGTRCPASGLRWIPDSPEARRAHPEGRAGLMDEARAYGQSAYGDGQTPEWS